RGLLEEGGVVLVSLEDEGRAARDLRLPVDGGELAGPCRSEAAPQTLGNAADEEPGGEARAVQQVRTQSADGGLAVGPRDHQGARVGEGETTQGVGDVEELVAAALRCDHLRVVSPTQ